MKKRCETSDAPGTAISIASGLGSGWFCAMAFGGPVGLIAGFITAMIVKGKSKRETATQIDEISGNNPDEIAKEFRRNNPGAKSATVRVTKYPDALVPLPQTRTYHYIFDDVAEDVPSTLSSSMIRPLLADYNIPTIEPLKKWQIEMPSIQDNICRKCGKKKKFNICFLCDL